jgi:hypothetical protein
MSLKKTGLAVTVAMLLISFAAGGGAEKLHGTWIGSGAKAKLIILTFGPNNVVKVRVAKDTGEGTYTVDWKKKPVQLDIDWKKQGKITTIIELMDGHLKIENVNPGDNRPKTFTDAVIFKREKVNQ